MEVSVQRSGDEGDTPADWQIKSLGDLGVWLSGGTPKMSNETYWGGDIPWVSPKDMKRPRLKDSLVHVTKEALGNGAKLAPQKSILLVVRGMILAHSFPVARAERSMAFNQDIKALVTHDSVDSNFLLWWLRSNRRTFLSRTTKEHYDVEAM